MGKPSDQLPPSEALPGIGEHCIVFHNGNGFYYFCKEFSSFLDKRLFQCVRRECGVTASMGEGCGSPLIDSGVHSHQPDLTYREKCLLVHNIRQQFQVQDIPTALVLREALSFIEENEESRTSSPQNFECVTLPADESFVNVKQEQSETDIDIDEDAKDILMKSAGETMTVDQLLGEMENNSGIQIHSLDSQPTTSQTLQMKTEEYDIDDDDDNNDEDYSVDESNKRKARLKPTNRKKQNVTQSKKIIQQYSLSKTSLIGRTSNDPSLLRLKGRHFPSTIPATENKAKPRRACHVCRWTTAQHQHRKDTVWMCSKCDVPLCVPECFITYHTKKNF